MCRSNVKPQATPLLVELLQAMALALEPEYPERVVIGPVDFGDEPSPHGR